MQAVARVQALQQVLVKFPRTLEWLDLLEVEFTGLDDSRAIDALAALQSAVTAMDQNGDFLPDLVAGPSGLIVGTDPIVTATGQTTVYGTASDGDVRAGQALSFTDNGDGTITDNNTGLVWEKKDDNDSGGVHDVDNTYTWSTGTNDLDGTVVSDFLDVLNDVAGGGSNCFAGHCDWRMPNYKELTSIMNLEVLTPVIDPAFYDPATCPGCADVTLESCNCATSAFYWSSSTVQNIPGRAWGVGFTIGLAHVDLKTSSHHVRAVRGGL